MSQKHLTRAPRSQTTRRLHDAGFALLETLAVMVIVGLLAGTVLVQVRNWQEKVALTEVIQDARNLGASVESASVFFDVYQPLATSGAPVEVKLDGIRIHTLNRSNKLTGYEFEKHENFTLSVYNGPSPTKANSYATYSAKKGGICASGFGPVQPCPVVDDSTAEKPTPTPTPEPAAPPVVVPPASPSGVGNGGEKTPDEPLTVVENVVVDVRPGDITSATCPESYPLIDVLKNKKATEAVLPFSWTPSARATSYDVQLMPMNGNASTYKLKKTVSEPSTTFTLPRQELDQWGNPAGAEPAYYGDYSLRIQPVSSGVVGEPYYRVFQFRHYTIQCNPQSVVPEADRVSTLGLIPPSSIMKTSKRYPTYEDVTFSWGDALGATQYKFTVVSTKDGPKWGGEKVVSGNSVTVRLPRKASDQYGNPIGGPDASYYDSYWLRIQPQSASENGDSRFRKYRHFHYEEGSIHAPDGYF